MTVHRLLIATFAFSGWGLACLQALVLYNILFYPFDDSISLAGRHTEELLALHERRDQTQKIIAWLSLYHGEAPSHQVMMNFTHWATSNTAAAEKLAAQLPTTSMMTERLAFAITDSGQTEEFCGAFAQSTSLALKAILAEIKRFEPTCG